MGRRADEAVTGDQRAAAWQSRHPQLVAWSLEFDDLRRRYPSPRLSREVRDLMRALRMLRGEARRVGRVRAGDALELTTIAATYKWPPS